MSEESLEWLGTCKYIIVETDCAEPVTVAAIKPDKVEVADGYRVRMKPDGGRTNETAI